MIRSSRQSRWPRRLLILAVAAVAPVLAGCEAGNNAPTLQFHPPTNGAGTLQHGIAIRNVFVLGPPIGQTIPAGGSAGVFLALVNTGPPDTLLSMSAPGAARSVALPGGSIKLPTGQAVLLTGPAPKVLLTGLTKPLSGGSAVKLIMNFQDAGMVTLNVPVVPHAIYYSTLSPAPSPAPSPTATSSPGRHGRAPKPTRSPTK